MKKKRCANQYKHKPHVWWTVKKPDIKLQCPGSGSGAH